MTEKVILNTFFNKLIFTKNNFPVVKTKYQNVFPIYLNSTMYVDFETSHK